MMVVVVVVLTVAFLPCCGCGSCVSAAAATAATSISSTCKSSVFTAYLCRWDGDLLSLWMEAASVHSHNCCSIACYLSFSSTPANFDDDADDGDDSGDGV